DVDSFRPGADFRAEMGRLIESCDVFLAVIGPRWLGGDTPGERRIDAPDDFGRIEIELAMCRGLPIIPVLLCDARMPPASSLPESIASLASRNALRVQPDPNFRRDMERVIHGIEAYAPALTSDLGLSAQPVRISPPAAAPHPPQAGTA